MVAQDVLLPSMLVRGTENRSPAGLWDETLERCRSSVPVERDAFGREADAQGRPASPRANPQGQDGGPPSESVRTEKPVPLGYMKTQRPGPQALRVPFAAFAGMLPDELGNPDERLRYQPPLELIVTAAQRTNEYSVFGSPLLEVLINWKWQNFVRRDFIIELLFYLIHLFFGAVPVVLASLCDLLGSTC